MTTSDRPHLPFRWSFIPEQSPRDGSIRWRWRAFTQTGEAVMECDQAFDTFTECMNDAKARGYGQ